MAGMHIQRYRSRRSSMTGCGCLVFGGMIVVLGVLALYATGALLPLVLNVAGVERVGDTQALFQDATPQPTAAVRDPVRTTGMVTVVLGQYGSTTLDVDNPNYDVTQGQDSAGEPVVRASADEGALMRACADYTPVCREGLDGVRIVGFDLQSNGVVVQVEADTGLGAQQAGLVLRLDPTAHRSFSVVGVDVSGVTYAPDSLPFGLNETLREVVARLESDGNALLRDFTAQVGGSRYTLHSLSIDSSSVTLTLR